MITTLLKKVVKQMSPIGDGRSERVKLNIFADK